MLTGMLADRRMMALVDRECAVVVPENEMKQYVVAAHADTLDFVPGDALADWATRHGKKLRGHTLLWNRAEYIPRWLSERYADAPAAALATWLTGYVGATAAHFGARIHSWDVVNETVDPATGALRDTMFNRKLGFDALRLAFTAARERAPHAQHVYNDYMSWDAGSAKHRAGVLKLLERFRAEAVPVDALGIQSHIGAEGDMTTMSEREREWRGFVDLVVAMGYRLLITEFDVSDHSVGGTVSTRDAQVAAVGKAYLDMMLSYRQLEHLLCWGLVDRYSWLQNFSPRPDQQPLRPLPYDAGYGAKPLRAAIAEALKGAPRRASQS